MSFNTVHISHKNKERAVKIFLGSIFFLFGFATLQYDVGFLIWLIVLVLLSYKAGVEFDLERLCFRQFWSILGFRKGKWLSLKNYNAITLKSMNKGLRRYAGSSNAMDTKEKYYQLLLIDSNKRRRQFVLVELRNKTSVYKMAKEWSYKLNLPLVAYHNTL